MSSTEFELERFRSEWQKEVWQRKKDKKQEDVPVSGPLTDGSSKSTVIVDLAETRIQKEQDLVEDEAELTTATEELVQTVAQMDLNAELELRDADLVPMTAEEAAAAIREDPATRAQRALRIYELAVEKEKIGSLSDALHFYRQAFRLDDGVDKSYRNKHFPESSYRPLPKPSTKASTSTLPTDKTSTLLSDYSSTALEPEDEELPSPLLVMPNEIVNLILRSLALMDLSSFTRTTYVCKKLAFLGYSDSKLWQQLCMHTYPKMVYEDPVDENEAVRLWSDNWRLMFLERPRIMFNGIYISSCNYQRYGRADSWNVPIHIVTYYRYLRFYPDGTIISMLTTREPIEIVPEFHRHLIRRDMFNGTWRMSIDGRVRIESQAPVVKYIFLQELDVKSSGRGRHNRLSWVGFWSLNQATGDRFEFSLTRDKPFYFSRVLSYDHEPKSNL
ncbi:hypothetical protein V1512DRAFT_267484, partial [Lipomyces arxii]|uniref:uncharacterized protein n=1 Tax=Lipomyces arxii TaxID=56418 RepID=UPI0034CEE337